MKTNAIIRGLILAVSIASCGNPSREKLEDSSFNVVADQISEIENNEEYAHVKEAGFLSAKKSPYSTFSIDVDAASYSNMRRMVLQGVLPTADAVRIEEWINYFNYSYPQPETKEPFSITTEYSECPWNSNHKLLHIGLKGKEVEAEKAAANNLVFLIDASGSMKEPDKLPLLKRAFRLLLPQLRKEDRISIVTYAGSAGLVLNAVSGNEIPEIIEALDNLEAGGSTAGGEGIELAYKVAQENYIKEGNNRVVLATDGDFNVGISSESDLEKLIEKKREGGIYLSVLGFGQGNIKDNRMELLADRGNGNYNYIDNFLEARKVLVKQFGGTMNTIAKDVKLQLEFNPAFVKEYRLIGYDNRRLNAEDFNDDKKDAGELGSGHTVTALYEIVTTDSEEKNVEVDNLKYQKSQVNSGFTNELATIKFRYKEPGKNDTVSKLIQHLVLNQQKSLNEVSANYKLASAVSEFALLMKDSEYKGNASFDNSIALAEACRQNDSEAYIEELIRLMKTSKELKAIVK